MAAVFTTALFAGSAAIACWVVVRFPRLVPSIGYGGAGAFILTELLRRAPISSATESALYLSVFGVVLPMLVVLWVCLLGLLKGFSDALRAMR